MAEKFTHLSNETQQVVDEKAQLALRAGFDDMEERALKFLKRHQVVLGDNLQVAFNQVLLKIDDARELNGIDRKYPTLVKKYS